MEHKAYFDQFLKNTVNIDQARLDSLRTSINAIQDYISGSDYGTKIKYFREQGSLAHGTIIKPLPKQAFDADIVMVVSENDSWEPKNYLQDLKRIFKDSAVYGDKARLSDVCVTLDYANEKKIDILPIFRAKDEDDNLHICHHRYSQLIRSEPIEFTGWLIAKNKLSGGNSFRKVTRIIKYIRNHKKTFSCPSVLLTTIIGLQITDKDKDSDAFSSVPKSLTTIFERISTYLAPYNETPIVKNPSESLANEDLGKLWTKEKFLNFKKCIDRYAEWARDALNENDHDESLKKWQKLLGDEFGKNKETKSIASAVENTQATEALPLVADAAHSDSLVDIIISKGIRILKGNFYNPPHLHQAPWPTSEETSICEISASYHESKHGRFIHAATDGAALSPRGALKFQCNTFGLRYDTSEYFVQWRVTNTGIAAKLKGKMRGDFYMQDGSFTRWEALSYRGVHFIEAFVIREYDRKIACKSRPFNVVIK